MNALLNVIAEVRFALRQLRKAPGFAATVVGTLGLGILAATVIFSVVNAVLLRPLALPEPDRLVSLDTLESGVRGNSSHAVQNGGAARVETSYPNFFDWRARSKSFTAMASYTTGGLIFGPSSNGPARNVRGVQVSSDFFTALGVQPELGRGFQRSEELPGAHPVVLSHATWVSEFASDAKILGKTIVMSDKNYTVVGVMPAGFMFPVSNIDYAFWMTFSSDAEGKSPWTEQRGWNQLAVVARLKDGVTLAQAKAEMDGIQAGLAKQYPEEDANETAVNVVPQLNDVVGDSAGPLRILFGAVCCLLLIVCANVAGLMLTRTSQRRGELALRSALGATRMQLLRQLLIEALLLSVGGGVLGILGSSVVLRVLPGVLPASLPRIHQIALSGDVLGFAVGVSVLTGLLFGVLPAWRASLQDPASALGESGRSGMAGRRHYRLQSGLVVAQTAIGMVLLVGAGLLIHSFDRLMRVDPGFESQGLLSFRVSMPVKRYGQEAQARFFSQLLPRLQAMQGVQGAAAAFPLPLTQGDINISFSIEGQEVPPAQEPSARVTLTTANYFETMRIPLKAGREFLATEQAANGRPVAMVNEAFAKRFFPGQNVVGRRIRSGLGGGDKPGDAPPMREIVGVAGNVKRENLTEADKPEYFIPYEQAPVAIPAVALRVTGDPATYAKRVSAELAAMDSALPVYRFQSYQDELSRTTAQERFQTLLLTGFAGIALLLAGLGLYAVLSYMVVQRRPELGLRIALGAQRGNVLGLMLRLGVRLAGMGLVVGLGAAAILTRFVAGLLYRVEPLDLLSFAGTAAVLILVSVVACLIPAWRASRVDPNEVLRAG